LGDVKQMDWEKENHRLLNELYKIQKNKSSGKLTANNINNFIKLIKNIYIIKLKDINIKAYFRPEISMHSYIRDNLQQYHGPFSEIKYQNNNFILIRHERELSNFYSGSIQENGVFIYLECNYKTQIGRILEILKDNICWSKFRIVKISEDNIQYFLFIPNKLYHMDNCGNPLDSK